MYNGILMWKKINDLKKGGKKKVVILPYGEYGRWFERHMKIHGMSTLYCIDNYAFDNVHVFKADDCRYEDTGITYLIATEKPEVYSQLKEDLIKRGVLEVQIESAQDGYEDVYRIMTSPNKVRVDFLCVGFPRCGTGALNFLLKKNPHIFMPEIRENRIFMYFSKEAHEFLQNEYDSARGYSYMGGSDPSYCSMPEIVHQYYGKNVKIIINLRDPLERVIIEFISETVRAAFRTGMLSYYKRYGKVSPAFMDEWMHEFAPQRTYYETVKKWMKYYPRNQVKILISEELVKKTNDVMDDVQSFIGLERSEKIKYDSCPALPSYDGVVASDYRSACINNIVINTWEAARDKEVWKMCRMIYNEILKHTTTRMNFSMPDSTRQYLTKLFREDIRKTEELIGRPLPYFKD